MFLGSTGQTRLDEAVREISTGVSPVVGEEFFRTLVLSMADAVGIEHVFIAELDARDHDRAKIVACASHGRLSNALHLRLDGSAGQCVLDQGSLSVAACVREQFPDDEMLSTLHAESFVGRRLVGSRGIPIGLIGAVHASGRADVEIAESVMETFAGRVEAELERRRWEELLVHRAEHDSLTDLPNRGLFMDRLRSGIARAKRNNQPLALLFVDLNEFKPVNDHHGHQMGDRLLRMVARRLVETIREVDTVARVGGDEFAVILEAIADAGDAAVVAAKISTTIGEPFSIDGHTFEIGASTGIAIYPGDGESLSSLLHHADSQMYRAKRAASERTAL